MRRFWRWVKDTRDWRIDYHVNLARASRRLVENGQYERALETVRVVVVDPDAVLAEIERAGSAGSALEKLPSGIKERVEEGERRQSDEGR